MTRCRLLGALILTALYAALLTGCVSDEQAPPDGNAIGINLPNTAVVDTAPTASSGVAPQEIKVPTSEPAETHAPSPTTIASQASAINRAADAMNTSTPTATHTPNPTTIPIPTPAFSRAAAINTYTPTSIPVTTPTSITESGETSAASPPFVGRLFSLERNIEVRDTIARVRLISTATRIEPVFTGYKGLIDGTFYIVFLEFEFEVLEYLMGGGNSIVWGVLYDIGGYDTQQEALEAVPAVISAHDSLYSQWNDREYIVFMRDIAAIPESEKYSIDTLANKKSNRYAIGAWVPREGREHYSINAIDGRFWLPAAASASGGASGASAGEQSFLLDVPAVSGASGEAAVRQVSISELKRLIAEHTAENQDSAATATPTQTLAPTPLTGGALHEASFEPASFGVGVGASISGDKVGVIEPSEFKHNGANVAIEQIEWSPNLNKVALKLSNQSVSLTGHHIDFIELDASVSLRLDFDDAESTTTGYGQTLSWEVCCQPWHPGDMLMLRIAKSATAASATIKPVCIDDDKDVPTATPESSTGGVSRQ